MAKEQKIIRKSDELSLDITVNKLLLEGWERSGDAHLVIIQKNYQHTSSDNEEVWYQTLVRDKVQ